MRILKPPPGFRRLKNGEIIPPLYAFLNQIPGSADCWCIPVLPNEQVGKAYNKNSYAMFIVPIDKVEEADERLLRSLRMIQTVTTLEQAKEIATTALKIK